VAGESAQDVSRLSAILSRSSGEHPLALAARNAIEEKAQREPEFKQHEHFKHRARITNHRARRFLETRATD
jgi:hypothetical protein